MNFINLALAIHRPEVIPRMGAMMRGHDVIFLEDPNIKGFDKMLEGTLPINEYLARIDTEYPEFSRQMCLLVQKLHTQGKKIYQVEPFLDELLSIHEFFGQGHRPEKIKKGTLKHRVYSAEKKATGALLNYYKTVTRGSFPRTIEAIKKFARADAARFRLRDLLRVEAMASKIREDDRVFIEAGHIHYQLWSLLKKRYPGRVRPRPFSLLESIRKPYGVKGRLYGPGDRLTLLYIFHPDMDDKKREDLLAARSIVYSKIIQKEEMPQGPNTFPHIQNEIICNRIVRRLSLQDCRILFERIRHTTTADSRKHVIDYLKIDQIP